MDHSEIEREGSIGRAAFEDALFKSRKADKAWLLELISKDESNFDTFFAGIILLNLIVVGIETDHGEAHQTYFRFIEISFLICFSIEFLLRLRLYQKWCETDKYQAQVLVCGNGLCEWKNPEKVSEGRSHENGATKSLAGKEKSDVSSASVRAEFFSQIESIKRILSDKLRHTERKVSKHAMAGQIYRLAWLAFDFALIVGSLIGLVTGLANPDSSRGHGHLIILRMVRILRVCRSIKLVRYYRDLYFLLHALFRGMGTLFWVVFLIFLLVFICAIFLVGSLGQNDNFRRDAPEIAERFGSLPDAMFTLFQVMTLEGWVELCVTGMNVEPALGIFFVSFIIFTHFTILNLFVAVLVENVLQFATNTDIELMTKMQQEQAASLEKLKQVFNQADTDGDHLMNVKEFRHMMELPEIKIMLREMGVETDLAWLFDVLDIDKSGYISIHEFLDGVLTTNSSELAKQLMRLQYTLIGEMRRHYTQAPLRDAADPNGSCHEHPSFPITKGGSAPNGLSNQSFQTLQSDVNNLANRLSNVEEEMRTSKAEILAAIESIGTRSLPLPPATTAPALLPGQIGS